jgi:tRNA nucleotidyltransferase (CCA-adding enzyme)
LLQIADVTAIAGRWEHFPHGADVGVRGVGATKQEAFEQAALALIGVMSDPARVGAREAVEVRCAAPDDELLLMDWLNALVFEMATRRLLFGRFAVRIDDHRLSATAWGEPIEPARHQLGTEVKGATCTALRVGQDADGTWIAQCVVDV